MKLTNLKTVTKRRKFIEMQLNLKLNNIGKTLIDDEKNIHCENLIGAISLPLGIAGPIKTRSSDLVTRNSYIPLATTEGALIASVNRGCKAVTLSGGAKVFVDNVGVTRGPVFQTTGLEQSFEFRKWLIEHQKELANIAASTSKHLNLLNMEIQVIGIYVYVRFIFDSQDAMGMNMVTMATEKIINYIEQNLMIINLAIAGNFDIDKKPAWLNFITGRGRRIWAECTISKQVVQDVLKTTPEKIFDVWLAKCMIGSAISGSLGFNSHFANIVAAFFSATGQDLAHVVEGSLGVTTTKLLPNQDLYFSIYLPDILIGTVGGGTSLKAQTEARTIIGVKHANDLAEVLAGAVVAGELSLLASLAEGSLAKAHQKLGR